MMREIKIRAWDDELKEMLYSQTEQFDDAIMFRFNKHFETEKPIFMQSTGLKDRNGVEIYEGDICKVSSDTFYGNSYAILEESWELMMQVVFCNYAFIFRSLQDKHLEILLAETLWEDFEIEIVGISEKEESIKNYKPQRTTYTSTQYHEELAGFVAADDNPELLGQEGEPYEDS